jgi:hypothetical protein
VVHPMDLKTDGGRDSDNIILLTGSYVGIINTATDHYRSGKKISE